MLITLFRRTVICQLVAEIYLSGVTRLGAVSHRFLITEYYYRQMVQI